MSAAVELNCRSADAGGTLDPLRAWLAVPALRGRRHLIVLIHGYNDTVDEARTAYAAFEALQAAQVAPGRDWTFGATQVQVFWPGDATWGLARPAFYPFALPLADRSAALLREIVVDLVVCSGGRLTLDVVAHSMGNRVALQMLGLLRGQAGLQVRRLMNLAAAVPVGRLQAPADTLAQGLGAACAGGRATSFYSADDAVLAYAFPVGETVAAAQEGVLPVALGHGNWTSGHPAGLSQHDASPAGHGDYWSGLAVQAEVRERLDLAVSAPRRTPRRVASPRAAPPGRECERHTTAARRAGQAL